MADSEIMERITAAAEKLNGIYQNPELMGKTRYGALPDRQEIVEIIGLVRKVLFPGYIGGEEAESVPPMFFTQRTVALIYEKLFRQICLALMHGKDGESEPDRAKEIALRVIEGLPRIQEQLFLDVEAGFQGDPAAGSKEELILSYPGVYAILVYRIAHILYEENVPLIPRIMSEFVHGETGIDINPGAQIGEYFFIDHGTGVVIGETTKIGDHVKIYQGVTLGALSTRKGQDLAGVKRHPTIEDNVVIYANATILGGDTEIGANSVIAGNTFVTESVPANSRVAALMPKLHMETRD